MRGIVAAATVLISAALPFGSSLASPALTIAPAIMRAAPSVHAKVVQSIPANAEIDVEGCGQVWCTASWRDISGFVLLSAVGAPPPSGGYYPPPPPPVVVVRPFGWGWGWGWGGWRHGY